MKPKRLDNGRSLLASNRHFVFERFELEPESNWRLDASRETWLLMLHGSARAGALDVVAGEAIFAQAERVDFKVGEAGVVCLLAYQGRGGPIPKLLQRVDVQDEIDARQRTEAPSSGTQMGAGR